MQRVFLLAFLLCAGPATAQDLGTAVQVPGTNDECAGFCDRTYSPHTFEEPDKVKACQQGCRLFSIIQLVNGEEDEAAKSCSSSCGEAFADASAAAACGAGCKNQKPFTSGTMEIVIDDSSPMFKYAQKMTQQMFDRMGAMKENVLGSMRQFLDDFLSRQPAAGEPQSPPAPENQPSPLFKYAKSLKVDPKKGFEGPSVGNRDENGDEIIHVKMIPIDDDDASIPMFRLVPADRIPSDQAGSIRGNGEEPVGVVDPEEGWMACLARRTASRWLLCAALLLGIISTVWICLAVVRTSPRRRFSSDSSKLTVKGDLDLIKSPIGEAPPPYSYEELKKPLDDKVAA